MNEFRNMTWLEAQDLALRRWATEHVGNDQMTVVACTVHGPDEPFQLDDMDDYVGVWWIEMRRHVRGKRQTVVHMHMYPDPQPGYRSE